MSDQTPVPAIQFTPIETEVMLHRMEYLLTADLDELFEDHNEEDVQACVQVYVDLIKSGATNLPVASDVAGEVLAESIEGATIQDVARDEATFTRITPQKARAVRKALSTAADKISAMIGRDLDSF